VNLTITGLESGYGSATVLRGVDLQVGDGEAVAVIGRNGMGKTTLLRTILGYLRVTAGTVSIDGRPVTGLLPERIVRRGVAYGPQDEPIFADLTVEENLLAARHRVDPALRRTVLDFFPVLGGRLRQRAGTLSGGEQKMLVLSRALLSGAGLMILDEVTAGLQPSAVDTVVEALRWAREEHATTLLLVEQNIDVSLAVCDRVTVLDRGRFAAETSGHGPAARTELLELLAP
jgi:urea transport system ATP-binding protein